MTATYTRTAGSTVGSYTISATLSPAAVLANYNITYNTAPFTITQGGLTITASNASRPYGVANPVFTYTAAGLVSPDTVSSINLAPVCNTTASPTSTVGNYPITCTGAVSTANYTVTYLPGTLMVTQASSATSITSNSPNPSAIGAPVLVSFKVSGNGVPTGNVTVNASTGESCVGSLTSGAGSCSITFATTGARTLIATYPGDTNFLGSMSPSISQGSGDFTITATPASQTIPSGHQGYFTLTVTPVSGLTGSVALSCSGAPPNSTCTVSPSADNLQGAPITSIVTLSASQNVNHGTFTLTFTGKLAGGTLTRSTTVQLTVK